MKLFASKDQMLDLTPREAELITIHRKRKGYNPDAPLSIGEVMELIIAYSYNLHFEDSLYIEGEGFFDNILRNHESVIARQGQQEELFDALFYEARLNMKKRLVTGRTFNDPEEVMT